MASGPSEHPTRFLRWRRLEQSFLRVRAALLLPRFRPGARKPTGDGAQRTAAFAFRRACAAQAAVATPQDRFPLKTMPLCRPFETAQELRKGAPFFPKSADRSDGSESRSRISRSP